MKPGTLLDDDLWDYYSGLPSPLWYQQQNEENTADHRTNLEHLDTKDPENKKE